ncbi:hypothetical protein AZE42_04501 [Rhizopogon vesiculosus]|uniref:Uncharacterized protein n=1 Tax=Rhizopogon vesiculosus TaxID=180088 RepID=A0A1J8R0H9_9AGAM|nr:hypothetical protein AZE42_04501 [Rhizopogon vesiculosus]
MRAEFAWISFKVTPKQWAIATEIHNTRLEEKNHASGLETVKKNLQALLRKLGDIEVAVMNRVVKNDFNSFWLGNVLATILFLQMSRLLPWPQPPGIFSEGKHFHPRAFLETVKQIYEQVFLRPTGESPALEQEAFVRMLLDRSTTLESGTVLFRLYKDPEVDASMTVASSTFELSTSRNTGPPRRDFLLSLIFMLLLSVLMFMLTSLRSGSETFWRLHCLAVELIKAEVEKKIRKAHMCSSCKTIMYPGLENSPDQTRYSLFNLSDVTPAARINTPIAAIAWNGLRQICVYYITATNKVQEITYSAQSGWFQGATPGTAVENSSCLYAQVRASLPRALLRVGFQSTEAPQTITEVYYVDSCILNGVENVSVRK